MSAGAAPPGGDFGDASSTERLERGRPALATRNLVSRNRKTTQEDAIFTGENIPQRFVDPTVNIKILIFWKSQISLAQGSTCRFCTVTVL